MATDERLSAYLEGDLLPDEAAALEHELAHDADLRADLDAVRLVVQTLRDEGPVRAPLGFHAAVMDRIDAEHPAAPRWRQFANRPFGVPIQGWGVVLAAAAVLLVVQLGRDDGVVAPDVEEPVWREVAEPEAAPAAVKLPDATDGEKVRSVESAEPKVARPAPSPRKPSKKDVQEVLGEKGGAVEAEQPGGTDSAPPLLRTPPAGFTLSTRDPAVLREVLALVGRYGGSVTQADGSEVTKGTLDQGRESVVVTLPTTQLAAFQKALEALGSVSVDFDADKLYGGDTIRVPVTFQLVGGSSGTADDAAPKAAHKNRQSFDLEAMEPAEEQE